MIKHATLRQFQEQHRRGQTPRQFCGELQIQFPQEEGLPLVPHHDDPGCTAIPITPNPALESQTFRK